MTAVPHAQERDARTYTGRGVDVVYRSDRCLHAAECVRGLPSVFDTDRKPWIAPDNAPAAEVAEVIRRCPSGALQYRMADGTGEAPEEPTRLTPYPDGVLHVRGDVELQTPDGPRRETRAMLCGCSRTAHIPYCDHTGPCAARD